MKMGAQIIGHISHVCSHCAHNSLVLAIRIDPCRTGRTGKEAEVSERSTVSALRRGVMAGCLMAMAWAGPLSAAEPNGHGTHQQLVDLFTQFDAWNASRQNPLTGDFRPPATAKRLAELTAMQQRLQDMAVAQWDRPGKVDWLTVRAQMDNAEFGLKVTRPWARDPNFYLAALQPTAFTSLPVSGTSLERLSQRLAAIPAALKTARESLDDVSSDQADLAIYALRNSDGVEDGYPYRASPPAGIIGWYRDLLGRAQTQQPALVPHIDKAISELTAFDAWMKSNRPKMTGVAGVGQTRLDWYLRNVLLLPYTGHDVITLSKREFDRQWADYALERERNRALPELAVATSEADYERRLDEVDARVRRFIAERNFVTLPPTLPADWRKFIVPPYETPNNVPYIKRATPPNYWEQIQYRMPSPDHWHAVMPGHRFDNFMARMNPNPIRAKVNDPVRYQGWAVYLEETPLQLGFYDGSKGRERELIYLFGLWRAARSIGAVERQLNEKTADQVVDYWLSVTPLLDRAVARKYSHMAVDAGHGLEYTIGNVQMSTLLADRKRQLGEKFVLKDFNDSVLAKGRIPLSLVRWEMTGQDDEVKQFFDRPPIPE